MIGPQETTEALGVLGHLGVAFATWFASTIGVGFSFFILAVAANWSNRKELLLELRRIRQVVEDESEPSEALQVCLGGLFVGFLYGSYKAWPHFTAAWDALWS